MIMSMDIKLALSDVDLMRRVYAFNTFTGIKKIPHRSNNMSGRNALMKTLLASSQRKSLLPMSVRTLHATPTASSASDMTAAAFNTKHLAAGTPPPATDPSRLTLYNMRFCMYAHRSVLALLAKGVPFDVVNVNLKN